MTLYDYDLVVVGETPAGQASAEYAARHRARVAWLVGPGVSGVDPATANRAWRGFHALRECLLRQPISKAFEQSQRLAQVSEGWENPTALTQIGVDVIAAPMASPERFEPQGKLLGLQVAGRDRPLLARHYLLAPVAQPRIPQVPGLVPGLEPWDHSLAWDTLHTWIDWPTLPASVTILGREPRGVALAQMLARLGCEVTLVSRKPSLKTDAIATHWLESLLKAEGVRLLLGVALLTVGQDSPGRIQIDADGEIWQSDRLLLAAGWQPALAPQLGLAAAGLPAGRKLEVNVHLRTRHRQVSAVGAALGGDGYEAAALEQARSATRNALFWPWFRPEAIAQPRVVWTLPPLVQLGLSTAQTRAIEGDRHRQANEGDHSASKAPLVHLLSAYPHDNLRLQLADRVVGGVQLVAHPNGRLLGATLMGAEATEWSGAIALALQQKLSVEALAQMPWVNPSFTAMIQAAAQQWRWQKLAHPPRVEDLWERFFNWRRTGGI